MQRIQWLNEREVSAITGRAVQTLRNDRHKRKGIPYSKIISQVRYKLADIEKFMDARRITFDQ